jgi:hypothetical protein
MTNTNEPSEAVVERWKAAVYLDLCEQRNPGTDEFADGFNGGITLARDLIYRKLPELFSALSPPRALVEALKPFADLAEWIAENRPDYDNDLMEVQIEGWPYTLSVGWLREARALSHQPRIGEEAGE